MFFGRNQKGGKNGRKLKATIEKCGASVEDELESRWNPGFGLGQDLSNFLVHWAAEKNRWSLRSLALVMEPVGRIGTINSQKDCR